MSARYVLAATFYCENCTCKADVRLRGGSAQGLAAAVRAEVRKNGWTLNTNGRGADLCPSCSDV